MAFQGEMNDVSDAAKNIFRQDSNKGDRVETFIEPVIPGDQDHSTKYIISYLSPSTQPH